MGGFGWNLEGRNGCFVTQQSVGENNCRRKGEISHHALLTTAAGQGRMGERGGGAVAVPAIRRSRNRPEKVVEKVSGTCVVQE